MTFIRTAGSALMLLLTTALPAQRNADEARQALLAGNQRFVAGKSIQQPLGEGVRRTLARGQSPFAVVVCCTDSRVVPEHVFNTGLGELFVIRVAGNACDPTTVASIEHAADQLGVQFGVILAHEQCDAIAACVEQTRGTKATTTAPRSAAVQSLLERLEPAARKALARDLGGAELLQCAEEENAHRAVHDCLRQSALLRRLQQAGRFQLVAARYHLSSGEVEWLPQRPLPELRQDQPLVATGSVPQGLAPHVALRLLQGGHRRFLADGRPMGSIDPARRADLTLGQQPLAIVLTCADSRVCPEHLFDAGLGELVVIRNHGNTLSDEALASIESAVASNGTSLLLVMGHTRCTAIQGALTPPPEQQLTPSTRALLSRLEPAMEKARRLARNGDVVDVAAREHAVRVVQEARSRSPLLQQLEQQGRFALLPTLYDVASGDLHWLPEGEAHGASAMPPAMPSGETAKGGTTAKPGGSHGAGDAHAPHHESPGAADATPTAAKPLHSGHGASSHELAALVDHDHDHGAPATNAHEGAHADAHAGHPTGAHGTTTAHGTGDGHGQADGHGQRTNAAPAAPPTKKGSGFDPLDPITLVGIAGVASLLLAAVVVLSTRRA